ncbi:polysaccharide pyruvyl transferase family protein [Clostridium sp. LQ25]|uniref:polysaccharide pyruvyl transferase family protein n=1 Tax=Clostridium sp. LQ25 TaxID=2992805 RepID=UPI0022550057|nr:polysaccharide pyruvyl transferase family protein [Clostridium sp. LQ25]UZT05993.1 polysaccharide pyruvyl transferase family protein [Clostridium sp. LQ25]
MTKIGILTYHTGFNYGASLQAYALQTTIKKYNTNCEIINFETERFLASREMFSRKPKRLKEVIKIITRVLYYKQLKKRQKLFDDYTQSCLKISQLYRTEDDVIRHAKDYDCIVCGSDQIWNLDESDAPTANPIFFLNFPKAQRRVSYAASFGKWVKKAPDHEEVFLPWLKQFDMISVRETSGVEYLKSRGLKCDLVLDPTLLLDEHEYDEICKERLIKEKYILLFSWNCNNDVIEAAKKVSREMNLPIINIVPPPRAIFKGVKRKLDIGPLEFLSMVKNAEFVVTNSFHGTAFSTIYNKPYVSIHTGIPDPRMASLLSQLGLSDHLVTYKEINVDKMVNTDFSLVKGKMKILRQSSIDYLKKAIEVE